MAKQRKKKGRELPTEKEQDNDLYAPILDCIDQIQIPVILTIGDEEEEFVLTDADGEASGMWMSKVADSAVLDTNGKPVSISSVLGIGETLLSRCLYRVKTKSKPYPTIIKKNTEGFELVKYKDLLEWPARTIDRLANRCATISGLQPETSKQIKND